MTSSRDTAFGKLADRAGSNRDDSEEIAGILASEMTVEEKYAAMSGDGPLVRGSLEMMRRYNGEPIVAGAVPRLGIPGIRFTDGPRGVVMNHSTAFPVPMARGATFDTDLEERIGDAIGTEARALGANMFAGVCVNLLRHPAWGRAQETYGEDSHLLGEMGAALVRGSQRHVMSCVKHYAANSMENSRFWLDVRLEEADLRDLYLPHFKRCVDAGVASVMSAYNKVNGSWCGQHRHLLTEILKEEWGFDGFVMSDFTFGVRKGAAAVNAGMDLEMPFRWRFSRLAKQVVRGTVSTARVDDAVHRLLLQQVRFALRGDRSDDRYPAEVVACPEHRSLAREAAAKSVVLLRNDPVPWTSRNSSPMLPLDPDRVRRLAVIGKLASVPNIGDMGSSRVYPPEVVTVIDGLVSAAGRAGIDLFYDEGRNIDSARSLCRSCDAVIVVVGNSFRDEGEWILKAGGDRRSLRMRRRDEALVEAMAGANRRIIVVMMGGSALVTDNWDSQIPALMMAWYPGMSGGDGLADVIMGTEPAGGRLPFTWPRSSTQLPGFQRFSRKVRYGPLHGYRMMEATGQVPAFPFGFGLGYATISLSSPQLLEPARRCERDGESVAIVSLELLNSSDRRGVEVVQVYEPLALGSDPRLLRTLRAFQRVEIDADSRRTVELSVPVDPGSKELFIGTSSAAGDLVSIAISR